MSVGQGKLETRRGFGIDRDILLLPEVIIENYNTAPEEVLKLYGMLVDFQDHPIMITLERG